MSKLQIVLRYLSSKISSLAKFYEVDNKYWSLALAEFESLSKTDSRYAFETLNSNGVDVCPQFRDNLRGLFNRSIVDLSELKDKKYKLLKRLD